MALVPSRQEIREWEKWLDKLSRNDPGFHVTQEGWTDALRKLLNLAYITRPELRQDNYIPLNYD
jgi:hypothetical protein